MAIGGMGYGGIVIQDGGAVTQDLTTTAGAMVAWAGAGGANSAASGGTWDGDPSVIPDKANSRIKVLPGVYLVKFDLSVVGGGTANIQAQLRKNSVVVPDLAGRTGVTTARSNLSFSGILKVNNDSTDIPGTLSTFSDPSSGFAGAGGAPKSLCPIDVVLKTLASTVTVTIEAAQLTLLRLA